MAIPAVKDRCTHMAMENGSFMDVPSKTSDFFHSNVKLPEGNVRLQESLIPKKIEKSVRIPQIWWWKFGAFPIFLLGQNSQAGCHAMPLSVWPDPRYHIAHWIPHYWPLPLLTGSKFCCVRAEVVLGSWDLNDSLLDLLLENTWKYNIYIYQCISFSSNFYIFLDFLQSWLCNIPESQYVSYRHQQCLLLFSATAQWSY